MKTTEMLTVVIFAACFGFAGGLGGFLLMANADAIDGIAPRLATQDVQWVSRHEAIIKSTTYVYGAPVRCTSYINIQRRSATLSC